MPRFDLTSRKTATLFVLGLIAALATGCTMSMSQPAPTGLALQARIPAELIDSLMAAAADGQVSSQELQQITYNVVLVDDVELSNGGSARSRLKSDIEADSPEAAGGAEYLTRIVSWSPGQVASLEVNSLNPDARYLIVVKARLSFSASAPQEVFGFTRVQTRAGTTAAAQVLMEASPAPLVAALLNWYGIAVQLEATLLGGPTLSNLPPLITNQQDISFIATAEPGVTFIYSATGPTTIEDTEIEDTDLSGSEIIELTGLQEGVYTISVRYRDTDGLESEPTVFVVEIDLTPPAAPTFTALPPNPTNEETPSFTVNGEPSGTFVYSVSGATTLGPIEVPDAGSTGTETITLPPLNNGVNEVAVYVRDAAGNDGPESTFEVEVNTALPAAPVFNVLPPTPTNVQNPTFEVEGLAGGTFVYSVSGATTIANTDVLDTGGDGVEMITLPTLNEGLNTVSVFVRDLALNEGPPSTFDVEIDITPPPPPTGVFSVDLQNDGFGDYTLSDSPTFTWNGSGELGATWEYTTDGGLTWIPVGVTSATLGPLTAGANQFRVREVDLAGNLSPEPPLVGFEYIPVGEATISISNPLVPSFTLTPGNFTLDVNGNGWPIFQVIEVEPDQGITIDAYQWMINNETLTGEGDPTLQIEAAWADDVGNPTILGTNTLTLIVVIDGLPYSDDFFFTVEEN